MEQENLSFDMNQIVAYFCAKISRVEVLQNKVVHVLIERGLATQSLFEVSGAEIERGASIMLADLKNLAEASRGTP